MLRRVPFEKIENFRDLGGYASSYGETQFGVIYRSASLSDATPSDIEKMAELGIKSIIDLREDKAKKERPDAMKGDPRFKIYELSVNGNGRVPTSRQDMVDSYIEMLDDPGQARSVFLTLAHCEKPCVIHCSAGKDRTGCFISALLLANGVPFHDVNADYMLSFAYLTRLARNTKKNFPDFPKAVMTPNTLFMKKVYQAFNKKWGMVEDYFKAIGLDDSEISLLCNLLGKQEKSVGAVVFNGNDVLVEHMAYGAYSIPKGHVEAFDKSETDTALREIKEETGLDVKILSDTDKHFIDYSPKKGVVKRVVFYIAESDTRETVPQQCEVKDIFWLAPNDAIRTITFSTDRKTVCWAYERRAKILYPKKED